MLQPFATGIAEASVLMVAAGQILASRTSFSTRLQHCSPVSIDELLIAL